jgi:hypothetical protein
MPTKRTVLFLGAGASKALGYPLTDEILNRVLRQLETGSLFTSPDPNVTYPLVGEHKKVNDLGYLPDAMGVLRNELTAIFPGVFTSKPPPQITEVLSLLDHFIFTGAAALPKYPRERLARLRALLERAVATVVIAPDNSRDASQLGLIARLVKWLVAAAVSDGPDAHRVTIITTNYDLAVERPLTSALPPDSLERVDFGFNWRDPFHLEGDEEAVRLRPVSPSIAFYKLHGSINWLRCPLCEYVYMNGFDPIFHQAFASRIRPENTCTCNHWPLGTLLVAPSMIRDIRDPNLLGIWQAALEAMRVAERWVVVGYSLPPEDLAIRSLFMRASHARKSPPEVRLYEHGPQPEVLARYQLLLPGVQIDPGGFEAFINGLPV